MERDVADPDIPTLRLRLRMEVNYAFKTIETATAKHSLKDCFQDQGTPSRTAETGARSRRLAALATWGVGLRG